MNDERRVWLGRVRLPDWLTGPQQSEVEVRPLSVYDAAFQFVKAVLKMPSAAPYSEYACNVSSLAPSTSYVPVTTFHRYPSGSAK